MSVNEYAEKVVTEFITEITNQVFLYIERDDKLMQRHMENVNEHGLHNVNATIGKKVKDLLKLENDGESAENKSRLIVTTYTRHKVS